MIVSIEIENGKRQYSNTYYIIFKRICNCGKKLADIRINSRSFSKLENMKIFEICNSCSHKGIPAKNKGKSMSTEQKEKLKISAQEREKNYKLNNNHPLKGKPSHFKGKTYEEIFGQNQAAILRKIRSEKNPGKLRKNKTWIEYFGSEKVKQIMQTRKLRHSAEGAKNGNYTHGVPKNSGRGISGRYKNHHFRSLLELSFMINYLEKNNLPIVSAENLRIPYFYENKISYYLPDFLSEKTLYEVKPKKLLNWKNNPFKFAAGKEYCKQHNLDYCVVTDKDFIQITRNEIKSLIEKKIVIMNKGQIERLHLDELVV
jgi:hypothetical protein